MKKLVTLFIIFMLTGLTSQAQCLENRHSTNWYDGWISCTASPNPKTSYGTTHWIKYDLGYTYTLHNTKLWNSNDPSHLDYGIMDYKVDYSIDGTNWINLGSFTANQASGLSQYEGEFGPDFGGVSARYVLITPTSNYGGSCFGFSELLFNIDGSLSADETAIADLTVKAYPNPFSDTINIIIDTFSEKAIDYYVYDLLGRVVLKGTKNNINPRTSLTLDTQSLITGVYFIKIKQNGKSKSVKIIKK